MKVRGVVGASLSAAVGIAVGAGSMAGFGLSALLPALWMRQRSSRLCFSCALMYYLFALRAIVLVSRNFLGPGAGLLDGVALWIASSLALGAPWKVAWSELASAGIWRIPVALLISIVPPLGLIGFASPLAGAGILFPGGGYPGLALTLLLPGCLAAFPKQAAVFAGVVAISSNLLLDTPRAAPSDWQGVDTSYGGIAHGGADTVLEHQIEEDIKARAIASTARVLVFPESVLPHWTDASDLFWADTVDSLTAAGKTVVLGVIKPKSPSGRDVFGASLEYLHDPKNPRYAMRAEVEGAPTEAYANAIVIRGVSSGELLQRLPVPIGMWRPFTNSGVELRLSSPGTIRIQDRNVAILICYEQLIPWPTLTAFTQRPDVILAVANQFWLAGTAIPEAQRNTVRSWGRLFDVPAIFASNL